MPRMNYREIAQDIADRIAAGEYAPGARLPSYRELAELYAVHYATIQRALVLLRDRGVVVGEQGRGVFVAES